MVRWGVGVLGVLGGGRVVPDEVGVIQSLERFIVVNEVFQAGVTVRLLQSRSAGAGRDMTGCTFRTSSELIMLLHCHKKLVYLQRCRSFSLGQRGALR